MTLSGASGQLPSGNPDFPQWCWIGADGMDMAGVSGGDIWILVTVQGIHSHCIDCLPSNPNSWKNSGFANSEIRKPLGVSMLKSVAV